MSQPALLEEPRLRKVERRRPTRQGRTYHIRTFGCQMNEHDSEHLAGLFDSDGMEAAPTYEQADVIFINTCTIRENADDKLYGHLGHLKALKDDNPDLAIMVGGCAAQKDRELVQERAPWVDVVLGTHNLDRALALLDYAQEWGPVAEFAEELEALPSDLPVRREVAHSAWVSIQIGCNNTCTFCIVPSVRGREMSRRPGDVVREVEWLVEDGVVEVTLLGQNVNTYGRDLALDGRRRPAFAELLRRVGSVEGVHRLRFTSPHPADFREDVAAAMAETEAVCEQLHLPLQSGSDRILARMHRGYNAARYLKKLELARQYLPGLAVSTDLIVGFPGETEEDFQQTLDLVSEARYDSAFMFIFSPRPGTQAATLTDEFVPPEVIADRFARLTELQNRISLDKNEAQVGARLEVLVEGPSKKDPTRVTARTRGNHPVHIPGEHQPGVFVKAQITEAFTHYLVGSAI
ncbi:MAG: tRNA (N6-isopentenyl adenosine(37)-C2)-methylthiotransferase MiaB [Acidimicrobiia bacterium]